MRKITSTIAVVCLIHAVCLGNPGRSFYEARPNDPSAVYFTPDRFSIKTDGKMDVSDALQQAINEVKTRYNFGILFIPEGRYLISKTIYIPTAVRVIGYGKQRPVIILAKNAPGYQVADPADKGQGKYMFWFVSSLSAPDGPIHDAGASTFYSALSNVNLKIGEGNPSAGYLSGLTYFAERGEFASAVDARGRVYIVDGDVYVYDAKGQFINRIRTPERPTGIHFGVDERTLYITGHHALYSVVVP